MGKYERKIKDIVFFGSRMPYYIFIVIDVILSIAFVSYGKNDMAYGCLIALLIYSIIYWLFNFPININRFIYEDYSD